MIEVKRTHSNSAFNPSALLIAKESEGKGIIGYIYIKISGGGVTTLMSHNGVTTVMPYNNMHVNTEIGSTTEYSPSPISNYDFDDYKKLSNINEFIVFTNAEDAKRYYKKFFYNHSGVYYKMMPVVITEFIDVTTFIDECENGIALITNSITISSHTTEREKTNTMKINKNISGYIVTYTIGRFPYANIDIEFDPDKENIYHFPINKNARYDNINWIGSFTDPNCKSGFAVFEDIVDAHKYYYNKLAHIINTNFRMFRVISESYIDVTDEIYDEAYNVMPCKKVYNCDTIKVTNEVTLEDIKNAYLNSDIYKTINTTENIPVNGIHSAEDIDALLSLNFDDMPVSIDMNYLLDTDNSKILLTIIDRVAEKYKTDDKKYFILDLLRIADKYLGGAYNFKDTGYNKSFVDVYNSIYRKYQNGLLKNFNHIEGAKFLKN